MRMNSVSFDEITFGDNDQLSAMICEMLASKLLVLLTKANGLFDQDPNNLQAQKFEQVDYDAGFDSISTIS